ncbi:hypothetical protein ACU5AY_15515 [Rhizobium sp. PAMB 3174]
MSETAEHHRSASRSKAFFRNSYGPVCLVYALALVAVLIALTWFRATDYLGPDNDDALRLVEVRDLLNGQGWFDMMQYRLGLDGGTLMHWSRFIDLPIAALISFFSLFLSSEKAEIAGVAAWPLLLAVALQFVLGLAALRAGGMRALHAALLLNIFQTPLFGRFRPGAIDHHNAQLVLVGLIAAMLLDPGKRAMSYAVAGVCAGIAIAIGAETTPFIAAVCAMVALQWLWDGQRNMARAAEAFGLSLLVTVTAAFFLTVPPARYSVVTCDNLSLGFFALASIGGASLFLAARLASEARFAVRLAALAGIGAAVAASALLIAPQCLHNPLADLDPMLVKLWLNSVTEAQSIVSQSRFKPESIGLYFAVPVFAVAVCLTRLYLRDRVAMHLVMLALISVNLVIGCIQLRSMFFANFLALLPLAVLAGELHAKSRREPQNLGLGMVFVATVLLSAVSTWGLIEPVYSKVRGVDTKTEGKDGAGLTCRTGDDMQQLAMLPAGTVASASNVGAPILRFTDHRVLSAPYHRNVGGMLAELHIGMAQPKEAEALLRDADVSYIAFCDTDPQTEHLMTLEPGGLYAELQKGEVPGYLKALPVDPKSGIRIFEVVPGS